ncbi:conserved hypothetical protein [Culex quinquefasciatus]|uniref:MYND-type domain-containing protein n=1 Tax=Culex quinquefasciatus TaxID=7176 RepID=B0WEU3_CULQU|nr:conserved hypothetical protein [Culex quinquefasciatus]|eukprot:XP_001847227.1 conserved hypothetical protein [Culex quinquefasciatus]
MRIINPLVHVPDDHSGQVQSAALQILCSIMVFATWRSWERGLTTDKICYCLTRPRVSAVVPQMGQPRCVTVARSPAPEKYLENLKVRTGGWRLPIRLTGAIDLLLERGAIRADFTLDFMDQRRDLLLVPEQGKCDADAARFRNTGNRLYLDGKYGEALVWCFAEKESDQMATGYGNRKVDAELRVRELNCKQQIAAGPSKGTVPSPQMDINVDTNPKIPFLDKGKKVDHRRILVAEKDINPGDVIMDAEPLLTAIDFNLCYKNCSHCGVKFSNSLIPCPDCVFFMYCEEECRQKSWKLWHQFECPVATELRNFSNFNLLSTPRLSTGAELNRFELDYSNQDRRELFRILHNTEACRDPIGELNGYLEEKLISYDYFLVFQANPLMATVTTGCRNITIQTLNKLARLAITLLSNNRDYLGRIISCIIPAIPTNIHTCDPHAHTAFESGRKKKVLLRPVPAGKPFVEVVRTNLVEFQPGTAPHRNALASIRCHDQGQALHKQRRIDMEVIVPTPDFTGWKASAHSEQDPRGLSFGHSAYMPEQNWYLVTKHLLLAAMDTMTR